MEFHLFDLIDNKCHEDISMLLKIVFYEKIERKSCREFKIEKLV